MEFVNYKCLESLLIDDNEIANEGFLRNMWDKMDAKKFLKSYRTVSGSGLGFDDYESFAGLIKHLTKFYTLEGIKYKADLEKCIKMYPKFITEMRKLAHEEAKIYLKYENNENLLKPGEYTYSDTMEYDKFNDKVKKFYNDMHKLFSISEDTNMITTTNVSDLAFLNSIPSLTYTEDQMEKDIIAYEKKYNIDNEGPTHDGGFFLNFCDDVLCGLVAKCIQIKLKK